MTNFYASIRNLVLLETSKPSVAAPITTEDVKAENHISQGKLYYKMRSHNVYSPSHNKNLRVISLKKSKHSQYG